MNERIRELMTKCNYVVDGTCDTSREEQFAELIVQECARVAMRSVDDAEPKEAWYLIEEHFGVKS